MDKIKKYKQILALITSLGVGAISSGCEYDPVMDTQEFKNYLKIRGINPYDCIFVNSNEENVVIQYKLTEYKTGETDTINTICKQFEMTPIDFVSYNLDYQKYKYSEVLPKNITVNIVYSKELTIKKEYINYEWREFIVSEGDTVYSYADGDPLIVSIIQNDNNLDDKCSLTYGKKIYVPTSSSVYHIDEATESYKLT